MEDQKNHILDGENEEGSIYEELAEAADGQDALLDATHCLAVVAATLNRLGNEERRHKGETNSEMNARCELIYGCVAIVEAVHERLAGLYE